MKVTELNKILSDDEKKALKIILKIMQELLCVDAEDFAKLDAKTIEGIMKKID